MAVPIGALCMGDVHSCSAVKPEERLLCQHCTIHSTTMAEQQQEQEPARQRLEVPSTSLLGAPVPQLAMLPLTDW